MFISRPQLKTVSLSGSFCPDLSAEERLLVGVSIGKFDAFHLGHQKIFSRLIAELELRAAKQGLLPFPVMISFYPSPVQVLAGFTRRSQPGAEAFLPVFPWRMRLHFADEIGFEGVLLCHFTEDFSRQSPEDFVQRYLFQYLKAKLVVVGEEWNFGAGRSGSTDSLIQLGGRYGFDVCVEPPVFLESERVSTSRLKLAVLAGDMTLAAKLMGRRYSIWDRVIKGERRGRQMGFPTVNQVLAQMVLPRDGVYATYLIYEGERYPSVTNVGFRPTVCGTKRLVETHVIDRKDLDLYHKSVEVEFVERLRDEMRFGGMEHLKQAIARDIEQARLVHMRCP